MAQAAIAAYRKDADKVGEASVMRTMLNAHLAKAAAGVNPNLELAYDSAVKMETMKQQKEAEMDSAIEIAKEAVGLFRAMGSRKGEAEMMLKIAEVHLYKDEPDQAIAVAREARAIYTEVNDPHGEAQALHITINANMSNEEDTDDALTAAKDVVKLFQGRDRKTADEDKKAVANALHTLAQVHLARFEAQEALEAAQSAQTYFLEANEKKYGTALVLNTISQIHQVDGKMADALKAAKQSMEVYQEIGYRPGEANALHNVAYLELTAIFDAVADQPDIFTKEQSDKLEVAWKDAIQALEIFQELKMADGEELVTETINIFIEKARKIHVQQFQPTKTIFLNDPKTRVYTKVSIYDTVMPEAVDDEEDEEGEDDAE
jgi:tetratricopeptide (TPR) repeat protein